jgi:hypothetical protein
MSDFLNPTGIVYAPPEARPAYEEAERLRCWLREIETASADPIARLAASAALQGEEFRGAL